MVTLDLNRIDFGKKRAEEEQERYNKAVRQLVELGLREPKTGEVVKTFTKEEAEARYKHLVWNSNEYARSLMTQQVENYFEIKYRAKEDKARADGSLGPVVAPLEERRRGGKVIRKIQDAEGDTVEMGDEDFKFLVDCFGGDSAFHKDLMVVYEVIAEIWEARVAEKKAKGE